MVGSPSLRPGLGGKGGEVLVMIYYRRSGIAAGLAPHREHFVQEAEFGVVILWR